MYIFFIVFSRDTGRKGFGRDLHIVCWRIMLVTGPCTNGEGFHTKKYPEKLLPLRDTGVLLSLLGQV